MDEEIKQESLNDAEQTAEVDATTTEQTAEDVEQPEVEEASETEESNTETADSPKKGYQSRVRELVREKNEYKEKVKSLSERLEEISGSNDSQGPTPYIPYQPQIEPIVRPGEEISAEELDRRIQSREQRIIQQVEARNELRQKQSEAVQRINNEAQQAIKLYPELDPDSESFDKDLSESVTEAVEAHVRVNPYSASVAKFVAKQMRSYKGSVAREAGKASENIAKQVSQAAIRPASIRKGEKPATEKSVAELEADLGIVYS